ncbi:Phenylalanine--tRNA ligase alpha subunit [Labeo rohita]|uniref:phenylalanine--tRNA ligase n=1 Tax=Labeo rohita TaxID=84645 RepID=A0ABQ8MSZ2_LABRO|nr:Phenylalanine--tRNA ligase alpha subunit [Labeo rohita]
MADTGLLESLLRLLEKVDDGIDSQDVAADLGVDHQVIVGAVKSLQALGEVRKYRSTDTLRLMQQRRKPDPFNPDDVISAEQKSSKRWELTGEGCEIAEQGSHEARVFKAIPDEGLPQNELMVETIEDAVRGKLQLVQKGQSAKLEDKEKNELKKRKLLSEVTVKSYWITKGSSFSTTITKQETELTPEMIASGSWKEKKFKPYNFEAMGVAPDSGHLHPLMKVRTQFRQIFLEMGFTEMPTNNFVESSFWNFDSLFQPQQHPARDQHDTFFISDPALAHEFPQDYLERVKKKNLLRTHTTAVSARMLYKVAQQEKFTPVKYFSIDRVFRNETLDATHLAEFHQIEGVVADYGLTLGNLMGILHQFFTKLGITKLRFKPAYNPYTEPSMEVFSYHEGLKKWVEVGNSGAFRPEMLLPMGLPEGVSVIAWGLSLERPTMIKYGINNIRELVGHKVNLQMVYDSPICRLDS